MKVMLHHSIECKFQFLKGDSVILVFSYFRILKSVWIFPTVQFKIPPHKAELILTFLLLQRSPISSIWSSWHFWLWSHVCFSQVFEICFPVVAVALLVWKKNSLFSFSTKKISSFLLVYGDFGFKNLMRTISCRIYVIDEEDHIGLIAPRKH